MGFGAAVATCLRKYVTFSGRARRPEYWWFVLFVVICSIAASFVDAALFGVGGPEGATTQIVQPLFSLATFLPMLAAGWRRMHDTGRPGWYLLIPLVVGIAMSGALLLGGFGLAEIEQTGVTDPALETAAAGFGIAAIALMGMVQLVLAVIIIWWLTRPTEPQANAYGPVPE